MSLGKLFFNQQLSLFSAPKKGHPFSFLMVSISSLKKLFQLLRKTTLLLFTVLDKLDTGAYILIACLDHLPKVFT